MGAKILIIEDEKKIARFMQLELEYEDYQVAVEYTGPAGLKRVAEEDFDLVLLDIMLPEMDGREVCREIRKISDLPVIMVTARDAVFDKVEGLDIGADDYITKPFAIEELLARIRVHLRRRDKQEREDNILQAQNLIVDLNKYQVKRKGELIELTKKEFDLLAYLLRNKGIVLPREEILNKIWGYDYIGETNVVDVYIRYLRSKIDEPFAQKLIHTVRGVGYVLRDDR
ncbi:MAG: response regulator transcription factor [Halanaerobiales bacterium]|nr:response regulator transcription factor [Halanaerobiales bacterium]